MAPVAMVLKMSLTSRTGLPIVGEAVGSVPVLIRDKEDELVKVFDWMGGAVVSGEVFTLPLVSVDAQVVGV